MRHERSQLIIRGLKFLDVTQVSSCASLFKKRHFTALFGPGPVYCTEVWPFKIKTLVKHYVSCWETICLSIFLAQKRSSILLLYCSRPLCGYCVSSFNNSQILQHPLGTPFQQKQSFPLDAFSFFCTRRSHYTC